MAQDSNLNINQIIKRGRINALGNKVITPEFSAKFGAAHGTSLGDGIVVVGREYNNLNRMIKRAYIGGVMGSGVDLLNLHSAPVPVLQFCIRRFGASGGSYFSSGASSKGNMQIRLFDSAAIEYSRAKMYSINEIFCKNQIKRANPQDIGTLTDIPATHDIYKKSIPKFINPDLFKKHNLSVVVDCSYGPSSLTVPDILSNLNVDIIAINSYESERQTRESFPNIRTVKNVVSIVKASKADLGVILDPDGSRCLFINDQGDILNYEELMMFFIQYYSPIVNGNKYPIIASKSSSKVLHEFCQNKDIEIFYSDNFPGDLSRSLREERATFGGADTFKFYFPQYGPFSDACFTTLKILEVLAEKDMSLSSLIRTFPRTILAYKSLSVVEESLFSFSENFKVLLKEYRDSKRDDIINHSLFDFQDIMLGVKLVVKDLGWAIVSPSIHSNSIEITAEGKNNNEQANEMISIVEKFVDEIDVHFKI